MRNLLAVIRDLLRCHRSRVASDARLARAVKTIEARPPRVRLVKPQTAAVLLVALALVSCSSPPDRRPARINHRFCLEVSR